MSGGLLGKKMAMTQVFDDQGQCIPVTALLVGPCTVIQKKTLAKDGYAAVQIGFGELKEKKANKPRRGHFEKNKLKLLSRLKEFRVASEDTYQVGQVLDIALLKEGDRVDVIGVSKGKGFQGVMKRHGHQGGPAAHGSHFHRTPGSIGQCTSPGEVMKGQKLPGRMGGKRVTTRNLKVIAVRPEENIILAKGAVPGANDGIIFVRLSGNIFEERVKEASEKAKAEQQPKAEDKVEATVEETVKEKAEQQDKS